jgi:hypothetical protein
MKLLLTVCCLILAASLTGQVEHAPTVAQCQADQRLWLSKVEDESPTADLPSYSVLFAWGKEMSDCEEVDHENHLKYYNTKTEITYARLTRLSDFLGRHDLWSKFLEEDAAGKR